MAKKWALDEYQLLGRSGLRVSPLCCGTMTFGSDMFGSDFEESKKVFDSYYSKGGNFFDTANIYSGGESEKFLGKYISNIRSRTVVATKYSFTNYGLRTATSSKPSVLEGGNSRKSLVENIDESLKRLGIGYIDLLYVHFWESRTPIVEVMRALDDVVRSGKVLYTGISDTPSWVISSANTLADLKSWSPFIALQSRYNLLDRSFEYDLGPMAREFGLGAVPWGSIAEGFLSGKYKKGDELSTSRFQVHGHIKGEQNWQILKVVEDIAKETKKTPSQVSLNWLLSKGCTSPIVGARTVAQMEENLRSLDFSLSDEQVARLDKVSRPNEVPFPSSMLAGGFVDKSVTAGKKVAVPIQFKGLL